MTVSENKVAVIDLGTNTFHLMLAEWDGYRYNIIKRDHVPVKVGVGGINQGIITEDGADRAIQCLRNFKTTIDAEHIPRTLAFGTSAFRNARNGKDIATRIERESGIHITIISGEEEASFIYNGVRAAVPFGTQKALIIDIGGGSVEFIIGTETQILWKRSFEIGGQRLFEMFHRHDPILPSEITELNHFVSDRLDPLAFALKEFDPRIMIGSSGTFDTLSEIHSARHGLVVEPNAPETPLTLQSFQQTFDLLRSRNRSDRMKIPGMIGMRVDMIVVTCCLIRYLLDHHSYDGIRVSSWSLKEGVLASLPAPESFKAR